MMDSYIQTALIGKRKNEELAGDIAISHRVRIPPFALQKQNTRGFARVISGL